MQQVLLSRMWTAYDHVWMSVSSQNGLHRQTLLERLFLGFLMTLNLSTIDLDMS